MKTTTNTISDQALKSPVSNSDAISAEEIGRPADAGGSADGVTLAALEEENERLRTSIRLDKAHRRITDELVVAGARSPELLFQSIAGDLQFDADGGIVNAQALVKRLMTVHPEQFGASAPASIDGGSGVASAPQLTKEVLARMKPGEIAALDWNDVRRVLAA
ncbi:MAG: hypothetical protein WKF34_08805 [Pyrinomonadaceae bacterium]